MLVRFVSTGFMGSAVVSFGSGLFALMADIGAARLIAGDRPIVEVISGSLGWVLLTTA
jgi:hypothetical protein